MKKATVKFEHMAAFFDAMADAKGQERYEILGHESSEMSNCGSWTIQVNTLPHDGYHGFIPVEVVTTLHNV